jgi:hypothetical protein
MFEKILKKLPTLLLDGKNKEGSKVNFLLFMVTLFVVPPRQYNRCKKINKKN